MKMTVAQWVESLTAIEGLPLCSALLYGSAAAGDHAGARSDLNVLLVFERLGLAELDALAGPTRRWVRAGNPPPMLFTRDRLVRSADVFPIEFLDLQESRQILHGEDVLAGVRVQQENLRIEVEHELKGKLAHLQSAYLRAASRPRLLRELMIESLSTFLVLARALLRFFDPEVPPRKLAALQALRAHVDIDAGAFEAVQAVKEGQARPGGAERRALFGRYLAAVEQLVVTADTKLDPSGGAGIVPALREREAAR